jgi:nitronate monooxygenase
VHSSHRRSSLHASLYVLRTANHFRAYPHPLARQELTKEPRRIGIGILAFATNHMDEPTETSFLMQIIAARPAAIWLAFEGVRGTHKRLMSEIRRLEKNMHGERAKIMIMVGTVELAKEVATYDIDVIVAQGESHNILQIWMVLMEMAGTEAGGHANDSSTGLPLGTLLPLIHSHLLTLSNPPLLLAAGGLSTGQDLVSILPYASGMVCGTAFTCCPESKYGDIQKSRLLAAKSGDDTVKTASFDRIRGHEFGDHIDGRALRNSTTREEEEGVSVEKLRQRYLNCANEAELLDRSAIWCGTSLPPSL